MSRAVARRIDSASSRRAIIVIFAPGNKARANASHSARMGSIFARMNSASRIDSSIGVSGWADYTTRVRETHVGRAAAPR